MPPADKYRNYDELKAAEREEGDYRVHVLMRAKTSIAIIAPHGGGIEPGTSEIAAAIAGEEHSLAMFAGIKPKGNRRDLHITSTRFDEPRCVGIVQASQKTLAIHGEESAADITFLGGKDHALGARIKEALFAAGFRVERHSDPELQGTADANICNRNGTGAGVQLELGRGLRERFFESLNAAGRQHPTPELARFVGAVRAALTD